MHPALERQIRRLFGAGKVPKHLAKFLKAVSETYESADSDRLLLERALELTSEELLAANEELRRQSSELERTVEERTKELLEANRSLLAEIAERRSAQAAREKSEQRYRALAENSPSGIFHSDANGRTLYVNRAWTRITGLTADEAVGFGWQKAIHPEDRKQKLREWQELVERNVPLSGDQYRILKPDGSLVWVQGYAVPLRSDTGEVRGYVGSLHDITEHKEAQNIIRESEERYRNLFEQSHDAIYISTPDGRLIDANAAGCALMGFESRDELLAIDAASLYADPEDRKALLADLTRDGEVRDRELSMVRADGEQITVVASVNAVRDASGALVQLRSMVRDVTERKLLERQLRQGQKMEAVGRLAGGVAHDFNNLLTAVIGYADLLAMALPEGSTARSNAEEIMDVAQRGAALTNQLLAFSRRQVIETRVVDVNGLVTDLRSMLGRLIGEDVELVTELDRQAGRIRTDPTLLEQIVVNLAINSRDAMPDGGKLTIRTARCRTASALQSTYAGLPAGEYLRLTVTDTGEGIDEAIQERIFEPFFTTKPDSGTGLGLATVYGAVQQSDGQIRVISSPGAGTTFEMIFPCTSEKAEEGEVQPLVAAKAQRAHETILLAEDEPAVRQFLEELLEKEGYTVLVAGDGEEALALAHQYPGRIDLLLSDVVMPKVNGLELARSLRSECPEVKILLVTGYSDDQWALHEVGDSLLQKPFTPQRLNQELRQLLGEPGQNAS